MSFSINEGFVVYFIRRRNIFDRIKFLKYTIIIIFSIRSRIDFLILGLIKLDIYY